MIKSNYWPLFIFCFIFYKNSSAQLGTSFPDVMLKDLDGKPVNTAQLAASNQLSIISFWATYCAPCRTELNTLRDAYPDWKKRYNANIVAISIDDERALEKIQKMSEKQQWNFPIWMDSEQQIKDSLHFTTVPYMVILDKKGVIRIVHSSLMDGDDNYIEEEIAQLYKE